MLFGGAGADRFVYNPNEMGADTISDHGAGDQLVFHGIAEAMIHAVQIGADVQVTIGTWAQVTVQDMQLADVIFSFI